MRTYPYIPIKKVISGKFDHFEVTENVQCDGFVIPAGYRSNFASIPRWLWPFFPPHGRMAIPSIAHDYLYDHRVGSTEMGDEKARLWADQEFFINMLELDVPLWQAVVVYGFVRSFGKKYWDN